MDEKFVSKFSLINGTDIPVIAKGVPSFLGVPFAQRPEDLERADAAIIGIPYERPATAGRPSGQWSGYRDAPAHVRRQSLRFGGYLPELDLDVFEHLALVDYGDAEIEEDVGRSIENVARKIREVVSAGCRPITIGGLSPCASYAVIKGIAEETEGPVGVISLDTHADCNDTEYGPEGSREPGSATWEARMWDHFPNVDPTHHVEIGLRGPRNTRKQIQTYLEKGGHVYTSWAVRQMGVDALCLEAMPHVFRGTERTWFHLDMDVLDISAVPDWGDEPLGLSTWEVVKIVYEAGKAGINGLSFLYVAPNSPAIGTVISYSVIYLLAGLIQGGKIQR